MAQFVAVTNGTGPLYDKLHELLTRAEHPLGPVHRRRRLGRRGCCASGAARSPLIVTTNYDNALERALRHASEPFDVCLTYIAAGRDRGKFEHTTAEGETQVVDLPNAYGAVLGRTSGSSIVKVHGQARSIDREREGFVVSEDDYIGYLAQTEITNVMPGHGRRETAAEPFPVPRLRAARLERCGSSCSRVWRRTSGRATARGPWIPSRPISDSSGATAASISWRPTRTRYVSDRLTVLIREAPGG